jgi:copper chaperone
MIKLKIEGMTCNHCVGHVQQALSGVAGVQGPVQVSLANGEALVSGSPDPQALVAAVVEEGYSAQLVS